MARKKSKKPEAVIRLHTYEPCIITTDEYEELQKEVKGRVLAGIGGISDRICLKLLEEHYSRWYEAKAQNGTLKPEEIVHVPD